MVANVKYSVSGSNRATTRVILQNLLVLKAPPGGSSSGGIGGAQVTTATLVMTDKQSQTMLWALKNATWYLVLRPTASPRNSKTSLETLYSLLGRGLPADNTTRLRIVGGFPESVDGQ